MNIPTLMMSNMHKLFDDDPWGKIEKGTYPKGHRLYTDDDRFWVSLNDAGQVIFFVHTECASPSKVNINISALNVDVEEYQNGEHRLVCTLLEQSEDIINKYAIVVKFIASKTSATNSADLFKYVLNNLEEWSAFLKPSFKRLTKSEMIGFWGEMYVISEVMTAHHSISDLMRYWVGPDGEKKDITLNNIAVEVKTTSSSSSQEITINSLDQLEKTTKRLYLLHLQLTPTKNTNGLSLEKMYLSLKQKCDGDFVTQALFIKKTDEFLSRASSEQLTEAFLAANLSLYDVCNDFPKITRADVVPGIVDSKYRISINSLQPFNVTPKIDEILKDE